MSTLFHTAVLAAAEGLINPLLQRDSVTLDALTALQGKVLSFEVTQPTLKLFLLPTDSGVQLQAEYAGTPDTIFSGTGSDFVTLLTSTDRRDALFGKSIRISGDSHLAEQFQALIDNALIDWEGLLGDLIGDLPAHSLSQMFRWKSDQLKLTGQSLMANLQEYLQEEARILPTRVEAEILADEIESLQEQTERLAARINSLKKS
ncbi:SCP2 sterol-binding domain-containing protein [Neptuniibacter sp. CAU 1671]|uniref:ubiquinone biosynthesis accessory factor UbiJ n=1 Tax=Neptuniibacter sp. CAU 1671 TaxID=3032593 RepID=UPI0023D9DE08|nr:SCP2 sterol-binding domain-containing protein [Neptuniibacter sp. CAU 1671]MDF2181642.1 SCP2 sterol-binding domain-containing protein [Neptuniibacter sp. CAU 1671]